MPNRESWNARTIEEVVTAVSQGQFVTYHGSIEPHQGDLVLTATRCPGNYHGLDVTLVTDGYNPGEWEFTDITNSSPESYTICTKESRVRTGAEIRRKATEAMRTVAR